MKLNVNGRTVDVTYAPDTPLLWVLRDDLKLKGTKFGCGIGICGACTIHLDGYATRSCITRVGDVQGAEITTVEGLSESSSHLVQDAWVAHDVPQCGYCQTGFIMEVSAILAESPRPTADEVTSRLMNICRCGTYDRIRAAISSLTEIAQ